MFSPPFNNESTKMLIMDNNEDGISEFHNLYKSKGFSQSSLASAAKINRATINKWERQGVRPDPESLVAVADALNVPPGVLFRMFGLQPIEKGASERINRVVNLLKQLDDYDVAELEAFAEVKLKRAKSRDQIELLISKLESISEDDDQQGLLAIYDFLVKIGAYRKRQIR